MKKLIFVFFLFSSQVFAQNPTYQQKLYYSCKVWGFAKYYHSRVSVCQVNWDSVFTATLPLIQNAVTNNDFNDALDTMLMAAGPMAIVTTPFPDTIATELKRNRNWGWINDPVFRIDVKTILDTIKNNFRPHPICWVEDNDFSTSYSGWLVFPYDNPIYNANTLSSYPDETKRILMLFKYWNNINYFNPYNYVLDVPWDSTLYNNVLSIANALTYTSFYNSFLKIASNLKDAHVEGLTWSTNVQSNYYGPQLVLRHIPNKYVVVKSNLSTISKGDEIISVDGLTTTQLEDSLRPYISAGDSSVFRRYMCLEILNGPLQSPITIVTQDSLGAFITTSTIRNNNLYSLWFANYYPNDTLGTVKWKKWDDCNIGYVNMGKLQTSDVNAMYVDLQNTNAIIFDIRNYPNGTAWDIANLIYPNRRIFSKLTMPDVTYPGTFSWYYDSLGVNGNPTPYSGKVILLFNQETQSQAEYSCMILGAMPDVVKVGSQTAGADGNITYFKLSQDIQTGYSNLGVFYPNGDSTQRIGIVPDSIVYQTQIGIRHGRDEVLERALGIMGCWVSVEEDVEAQKDINIYPNPSSGIFTVTSAEEITAIEIYNVLGEKVWSGSGSGSEKMGIDLSAQAKGIYFVKVVANDKVYTQKVVIE